MKDQEQLDHDELRALKLIEQTAEQAVRDAEGIRVEAQQRLRVARARRRRKELWMELDEVQTRDAEIREELESLTAWN